MTSKYLIPDLKMDEGFRSEAYPDPLSGGEPYTVGFGATGPNIGPGTVWTEAQAEQDLTARVQVINSQLMQSLPWWHQLSDLRQDVFCNMAYNLGTNGLLSFHDTLACAEAGDYDGCATNMLDSKWANQVPNRANRLAEQMRTGVHA